MRCRPQVISHLYEDYGDKVAGMLDGMFSFVLLDQNTNSFIVARCDAGAVAGRGERKEQCAEAAALRWMRRWQRRHWSPARAAAAAVLRGTCIGSELARH